VARQFEGYKTWEEEAGGVAVSFQGAYQFAGAEIRFKSG